MHRRAWILLLILAALWGCSYLFIKVSLDDLSPVAVVFGRTLLGALVLVPIALRREAFGPLRPVLGALLLLAVVQVVVPFLLISIGEQHIASSLAGILVSAAPIFTAMLAVRFDQEERSHGWKLVGVLVGIAGVAVLFGVDLSGDREELLGGLAVLTASLGYAIGAMLLKKHLKGVQAVGVAAATMVISTLVLVPVLPFFMPDQAPGLDTVGSMLALGAGGTGIAFLIFYTLIGDVGPARASIVAYVAPAFAVAYGVALLDEAITVGTVVGLALILLGSYMAAQGVGRLRRRPVSPEPDLAVGPRPGLGAIDEVQASRRRAKQTVDQA